MPDATPEETPTMTAAEFDAPRAESGQRRSLSDSYERGDRVRTPKFDGTICDHEAVRGRWPVRPDDVFGEGVRYFPPEEIERIESTD